MDKYTIYYHPSSTNQSCFFWGEASIHSSTGGIRTSIFKTEEEWSSHLRVIFSTFGQRDRPQSPSPQSPWGIVPEKQFGQQNIDIQHMDIQHMSLNNLSKIQNIKTHICPQLEVHPPLRLHPSLRHGGYGCGLWESLVRQHRIELRGGGGWRWKWTWWSTSYGGTLP